MIATAAQERPAAAGLASLPPEAQASISAQLAKLRASDGAALDYLGYSVAVSGNTVVVGAPIATIGSNIVQGAAYVFVKPAGGWANMTETAKLTGSDGTPVSLFGLSVDISGDTVVVGAPIATTNSNIVEGVVYVFVKPAGGWTNMTETAKLSASDEAAGDVFGWSVSISGNTVAAGEPGNANSPGQGAAYVFVEPPSGWTNMTETAKLTASDGAPSDEFGTSVSISDNTVVAGAHYATISGSSQFQGAAYVFVEPPSGWANMTETAKLTASDAAYAGYLGSSASIDGNTMVAGAPGTGAGRGAAYVFVKPPSGWASMTETAELTGGVLGDLLGHSVGISDDSVVAGAPRWPTQKGPGAAYVFIKPKGGWMSTSRFNAKLTASDGATNDYFGYSVGISGDTVVSGAHGATIGSNSQQGAAYVFGFGDSYLNLAHTDGTGASAVQSIAHEQRQNNEQHRYRLIDLGTFGGPQSYLNFDAQVLNNQGVVAGWADTPTPDPFPSACFNPDCFVSHAFQWQNGLLTDLGALAAGWSSAAFWISDTGQIAGVSQNGAIDPLIGLPEVRGVLWQKGQLIDLGTLGGNESFAVALNKRGQVVGAAANTIPDPFSLIGWATQTRAFLWQNRIMQDLGTLGGPDAFAVVVNERRLVAGFSYTSYIPGPSGIPQIDPFLWENGRMTDLGTLGGPTGFANSLNKQGQVVGQMDLAGTPLGTLFGSQFHPFLWDRGTLTDLGTYNPALGFGIANWINDAGEIVGWADNVINDFPSLWENSVINNLGTVAGDGCAYAININSKSQVVGQSGICNGASVHAFLWEGGGPIIDLNTVVPSGSGVRLTNAFFINERGEIAAQGFLPNGDQRAFLLIPCREGDEGCEDNAGNPAVATQGSPPSIAQRPSPTTPANSALSGRGMLDRLRARRFPGLRTFGPGSNR
jgi:probable HAF family extracellular repeat protein